MTCARVYVPGCKCRGKNFKSNKTFFLEAWPFQEDLQQGETLENILTKPGQKTAKAVVDKLCQWKTHPMFTKSCLAIAYKSWPIYTRSLAQGLTIKFADNTNETVVLKRIREGGLENSRELGLAREARLGFLLAWAADVHHFLVRPQGNMCGNPCSQQPVLHSRYIGKKDEMGYKGYVCIYIYMYREREVRQMGRDGMRWDWMGKMDGWIDGWMDGRMEGWMDGYIDGYIDRNRGVDIGDGIICHSFARLLTIL